MTDQELKDLVASLAIASSKTDEQIMELKIAQAKTDEQMKKTDKEMVETAKQIRELKVSQAKTDEQMKKTDEQMAKTDKQVSKIVNGLKSMDSYIKNQSKAVERYFINSLEKTHLKIQDISFDEIYPNFTKRQANKELELDALLVNGKYVALLEVKTILHKNDVEEIHSKGINNFRDMCKEHKDKKLMVLVAGEDILKDARSLANEYGFVLLEGKDKTMNVSCDNVVMY